MIDDRFKGIVTGTAIIAGIGGFFLGVVPGSDLPMLLILWTIGIILILSKSEFDFSFGQLFRLVIVAAFVYVLLSAGCAVVQTLSLPVFYIVNPILDGIATYRILRATAKLFARIDMEETTSNIFTVLWSLAKDILWLIGEFLGIAG